MSAQMQLEYERSAGDFLVLSSSGTGSAESWTKSPDQRKKIQITWPLIPVMLVGLCHLSLSKPRPLFWEPTGWNCSVCVPMFPKDKTGKTWTVPLTCVSVPAEDAAGTWEQGPVQTPPHDGGLHHPTVQRRGPGEHSHCLTLHFHPDPSSHVCRSRLQFRRSSRRCRRGGQAIKPLWWCSPHWSAMGKEAACCLAAFLLFLLHFLFSAACPQGKSPPLLDMLLSWRTTWGCAAMPLPSSTPNQLQPSVRWSTLRVVSYQRWRKLWPFFPEQQRAPLCEDFPSMLGVQVLHRVTDPSPARRMTGLLMSSLKSSGGWRPLT